MQPSRLPGMLPRSTLERRPDARMSSFAEDFAAGLEIAEDLAAQGFQPLREQWIAACRDDLSRAIETRLAELPPGWRLLVSEGEIEHGETAGSWRLTHRFIAVDPHCPLPLPVPAEPRRWGIYGPIRREEHDL